MEKMSHLRLLKPSGLWSQENLSIFTDSHLLTETSHPTSFMQQHSNSFVLQFCVFCLLCISATGLVLQPWICFSTQLRSCIDFECCNVFATDEFHIMAWISENLAFQLLSSYAVKLCLAFCYIVMHRLFFIYLFFQSLNRSLCPFKHEVIIKYFSSVIVLL